MQRIVRAHLLLAATLFCFAAGCANMKYVRTGVSAASNTPTSTWNNFFLFGLAGDANIDLVALCPQGVARIEVKHSVPNLFVGILTVGLYTPTTTEVWCAKDPSQAAHSDVLAEPRAPRIAQWRSLR